MDESSMTLTPCAEFALVIPQSIPLLFFSVINFQLIPGGFHPFDSEAISSIFTLKIIVCALTVISMSISSAMSLFPKFSLKPIFILEYSILAMVWVMFTAVLVFSKMNRR
ncbi:unnamed protein product [Haemonchus placei]|uniref:Neur_chan_memb domain-containing protein n=1 Tax=Haemonchus placei TaxID=6290 RepID=A0A0N4VSX4_HAEPC|nr:unnamed protein product [Haemonchus placei]